MRTPFTHHLIVKGLDLPETTGRIVYENGSVVIVEMRQ